MKMQILITTKSNTGESLTVIDEKNLLTRLNEELMEVEAKYKGKWYLVGSVSLTGYIIIN